jgi:hypothetical protein
LFDALSVADQSSTHPTLTRWIFLGKSATNPTWLYQLSLIHTLLKTTTYYKEGMTCQKLCSVFGGHLIKHILTSGSREGILFFIMPPSCFASVYPPDLLQVNMFGKVLGPGACLGSSYFGNDLNLGLLPYT